MYAVFADEAIHYLGTDQEAAMAVLKSKTGGTLSSVDSLTDLQILFSQNAKNKKSSKHPSRLDEVLRKLEEIDLAGEAEEVLRVTKENSEKAIGQVRSMGLRGLKGLGEGFTALGDLLQKASEEKETSKNKEE